MTLTQIATLLNNTIVPNIFGQGEDVSHNPITIAEDLRNVVDIGTAIADLGANDLKDYLNQLVVGVYDTYCDTRSYKDETYDLFMDEIEYGGALQRVKAKLLKATDTAILNLDSAYDPAGGAGHEIDYNDSFFWGTSWSDKLYTKDIAFKIKYSISTEMFKKSFTSAAGVQKLIAMIEATIDNTLRVELNGLARGIFRKLILSASAGSRTISLITVYNTKHGYTSSDPGYVTLATWSSDENFKLFCQTLILELRKYMTDMNEKYNDGTVPCFSPEADTRCVLLTEFAAELDVALGSVYHKELVEGTGAYRTINYWQNGTKDLIPYIKSGSLHDQIVEVTADAPADPTTINHVVGVIYDKYSAFLTNKLDKTTSKYVPEEDFTTFFHHVAKSAAIDTRNCAVALLLA